MYVLKSPQPSSRAECAGFTNGTLVDTREARCSKFINEEGFMADEKARSQSQENEQDRGKAMGAGASAGGYQGRQENDEQNLGRNPQQSETAGQGGGIQGTGQRQSNPGGYTGGNTGGEDRELRQRDEGNEASAPGRQGQSSGE
jgi:hypothetical protein